MSNFECFTFLTLFALTREWLTLREDKIVAKGKGLMQTYWCEPISSHTISIASNERKFYNDESQANLNIE